MKLIFAGTPEFAAQALAALIAAGHQLALVLTQPDRPSGRGMALRPSPVKTLALEHGIEVFQPPTLRDAAAQARLQAVGADAMIVAAYGLILPQAVLDLPRFGCINIHASLLPRWRGAAPIHRAIEAGDAETGITLMQMDAGLDTGDMLSMERIAITEEHSTATLHDELAEMGARMVVQYLQQLRDGNAPSATPQPAEGVSYAEKIEKAEAKIDWTQSAETLARKIRALDPAPGCVCEHAGQSLKIWSAHAEIAAANPQAAGTVLHMDKNGVRVACGGGSVLCISQMQKAGGKRGTAHQVADALGLKAGVILS